MRRIYFEEEQRFNQPRVWILLFLLFFSVFALAMGSYLLGVGEKTSLSSSEIIIGRSVLIVSFSAIFWLMFKMKLNVKVTDEGIVYQFYPIIRKEKIIKRETIESYKLRKYRPIMEYGGYGIKAGQRKWGKAFNVIGNIGMQLYLKDGKKILFGTQRGEAFKYAIDKMMGNNYYG